MIQTRQVQPATVLLETRVCTVLHGGWRSQARYCETRGIRVDAMITDPPYSTRTHTGHDEGTATANRVADWAHRNPDSPHSPVAQAARGARKGRTRRKLSYPAWEPRDVDGFVTTWAPMVRGWWVCLTDHVLWPVWERVMERVGLYVFPPIACVEPGGRCRFLGDGPSNWTVWAAIARPKTREFATWGTRRGAYVVPPNQGDPRAGRDDDELRIEGGKPGWMIREQIRDYTRPGDLDLVCDPCAGGGTAGVEARNLGRRFIGGDLLLPHAIKTARAVGSTMPDRQIPLWEPGETQYEQPSLFAPDQSPGPPPPEGF